MVICYIYILFYFLTLFWYRLVFIVSKFSRPIPYLQYSQARSYIWYNARFRYHVSFECNNSARDRMREMAMQPKERRYFITRHDVSLRGAQDAHLTRESDITESKCLSDMSSLQPGSRLALRARWLTEAWIWTHLLDFFHTLPTRCCLP